MKTETGAGDGFSKVIHLRSLPDDVTIEEIVQLGFRYLKYGKITEFLSLKVRIINSVVSYQFFEDILRPAVVIVIQRERNVGE